MRFIAAALICASTMPWAAAVDLSGYAQDLGGAPVPVGAGPRALGMGGAFTAIADDATANTWNPGGMVQLERPEAALSVAYRSDRVRLSDGSDADAANANLDHLSLVVPFFRGGLQQTIGLAWQRQLDFTRSIRAEQHDTSISSNITLDTDGRTHIQQEGAFSSVSASYAIEVLPGLGLGMTAHSWEDDWTLDSRYERRQQDDYVNSLVFTIPPISIATRDQFDSTRTTSVKEGYSFVFGAWWQATPALTFAATVKPRYTLRLANEVELRQISIDPSSGTV
ncbi:MAG: hypothetical protein H0V44_17630, partial [Planctomycetes bacterium]|nr:hypothetical protein [Planctomycetota bacterium]